MLNILEKITSGRGEMEDLDRLERLGKIINLTSLCGLGQTAPNPVLSTIRYFRDEYIVHIRDKKCPANVCDMEGVKMEEKSLIDVLHEVQDSNNRNFIPKEMAEKVAKTNQTSLANVYSVATFYTMFSVKPRGRHIIRVCRSLSCHLAQGENTVNKLKEVLGVDLGGTTEDGEFTLEESSCLGMCSVAPAMMIDEVPFGNIKEEDIPLILKKVKEGSL